MGYIGCIFEQTLSYMKYKKKYQLIIILLISVLSFLSGLFLLIHTNLNAYIAKKNTGKTVIIYWDNNVDRSKVEEDLKKISSIKGVKIEKFYTPKDAIKILTQGSLPLISKYSQTNPKIISYTSVLAVDLKGMGLSNLIKRLKTYPGIKNIYYNPNKVDMYIRLNHVYKCIESVAIGLLVIITLVLFFLYYSVLKLTRIKECYILYITGASRTFLLVPFIFHGAILGLISAIIGLLFLWGSQYYLNYLFFTPPIWLKMDFLTPYGILMQSIFTVLLGIFGSCLAVKDISKKTFNKEI